jgi:hypothetical protein
MATFAVCPINGLVPVDNGSDLSRANNVVPTESDAVVVASTIIGAATNPATVIVTTGANFAVGDVVFNPLRGEKVTVLSKSTNTLTVSRGSAGTPIVTTWATADPLFTGFDVNGNPPHCPICGSAMQLMNPVTVTAQTGLAAGSQHPVDADAVYVTGVAGPIVEGEGKVTSYTTGTKFTAQPLGQHAFAALKRGDQTVTASTLNATVGP